MPADRAKIGAMPKAVTPKMNSPLPTVAARIASRVRAARGIDRADLVLRNARYLDLFTLKWKRADLAIHDGVIVGIGSVSKGKRTLDLRGRKVVPGFIDAHVHVESSLVVPDVFSKMVLARGTTTAISDPHELSNVVGTRALGYFTEAAANLDRATRGGNPELDLRVMLSSCVPATSAGLETNGGGTIHAADLAPFFHHPKVLGLAEMMNVPGVLNADPDVLEKLAAFTGVGSSAGAHRIDGHCPVLSGADLQAYAAAGITSCHESSALREAAEKLSNGIRVWIREGSVAKDLDALIPLLRPETAEHIGFCTDDRNPLDIVNEGHLDYLIRRAIAHGVDERVAYRASSYSVARHYGLDLGIDRKGAIAPGYAADLVVLDDSKSCTVNEVLRAGLLVSEGGSSSHARTEARLNPFPGTIRASVPEVESLRGPSGNVHVIGVRPGKILTRRFVKDSRARGIHRLTVLERHGHGLKPANAYVHGFGTEFRGAIASSVGHDSHNLIVVGSSAREMRAALAHLIAKGGGFAVVENENVIAELALPMAGLMSLESPKEIERRLRKLREASRSIGCALEEPFLQLAFLSLPVIPSLKLTDLGLVDVEMFRLIDVRAS